MLAAELTTLAFCWRIARVDGVVLGLTAHDQPLTINGLAYAASPGMAPSAVALTDGIEVDTMEVTGALSAAAISAGDLAAGRFDGAAVTLFLVDWADPGLACQPLARGTLGTVTRALTERGGSFTATLRGPTAAFEATAVELCAPECRAGLGDARCRVDLAPLTVMASVGASSDQALIGVAGVTGDLQRFVHGRLRPLDGANAGLDAQVAAIVDSRIALFEPLPFALASGTRLSLREGCDKRFASCAGRFGNAVNFRGEPHVPGGDILTRFPGL